MKINHTTDNELTSKIDQKGEFRKWSRIQNGFFLENEKF